MTCSIEGCENPALSVGLCNKHYTKWLRHEANFGPDCSVEGCENKARSRGMCLKHYTRWYRASSAEKDEEPFEQVVDDGVARCSIPDCEEPHRARGMCVKHYTSWKRYGDPYKAKRYKSSGKHGMLNTKTYNAWKNMKKRCYYKGHEAHASYAAQGIEVCDRWRNSFELFLKDMGPKPEGATLERLDWSKDYCPENCVWDTKGEQAINKSTTKYYAMLADEARELKAKGYSYKEIAEHYGIGYGTAWRWVNRM